MHGFLNKKVFIGIAVVALILAAVYVVSSNRTEYTSTSPSTLQSENLTNVTQAVQSQGYTGQVLAGNPKGSVVLDFNKADYDLAVASDKIIFLYFYAEWCPICRAEVPMMYTAFNHRITSDRIVVFRVNFNDGKTDADEANLANQFGVAYQHTKVILLNDQLILKSPESWSEQRYVDEINKVTA